MSRKHRHRENKVKKMHTIIGGYDKVLDDLAVIPGIRSVITGIISPNKSESEEMTFQYFTDSGLKLLAKTTEAVQEIFIVAEDKQTVLEQLRIRGFLRERVKNVSKNTSKSGSKKQSSNATSNNNQNRNVRYNPSDAPKEAKATTLKDLLNPDVLAKLTATSNEMKEQERNEQEQKRQSEVARREKEKKALESNFEYLLNNSKMDWKNFK
jgi:hypothetical protein